MRVVGVADRNPLRTRQARASSKIIAAPFSAIIAVGVFVLPDVIVGITEASATRKAGDAVKAQPLVDDGSGIGCCAHLRGADGMEDRGADIAGGFRQRRIVVADGGAGQIFLRVKSRQRLLLHQPPRGADGVGRDLPVFIGRQIVRRDRGRLVGLCGSDAHGAARGRLQIAGADRDGGEAVQGIAEFVERQRLHVELDVGALAMRIGAGEDAELRRRHGQRAAAAERVVEPHQAAPEQIVIGLVQGADALDLVDRALLQMVLQIAARRLAGRARRRCQAATASRPGQCRNGAAPASIRSSRRRE